MKNEPLKVREDGVLTAVAGTSRFGKTGWVKQQIKNASRLLIWDIRGEYIAPDEFGWPGCERIDNIADLAKRLHETATTGARISYWGKLGDFQSWCVLAYSWGQYWPAVIVGEEIADVTSPGKAPEGWGELIRKGLYYGNHIYAVSQRPAESDKTVWGNASLIHCHACVMDNDAAYMASKLGNGCTDDELMNMEKLHWIERRAGSKVLTRGKLGG